MVFQTVQRVQQFLRHRHPAGTAQALGLGTLGTFAAAALCGALHRLRRGLLAGGRGRGGRGSLGGRRVRCVAELAHLHAQRTQVILGLGQRLVDGGGGVFQIQTGGVQPGVHPGKPVPQNHHPGGDAPGVVRHAAFLFVGLLGQTLLGVLRGDAGVRQNTAGLQTGLGRGIGVHGGGRHHRQHRLFRRGGIQLALHVPALELPFIGGLLVFPAAGAGVSGTLFRVRQLGGDLIVLLFRQSGTLLRLGELLLQLFHTGAGVDLLRFEFVDLSLQLPLLFFVQLGLLLVLGGKGAHVCQHIILVKAEQAGAEPLFLHGGIQWRHGDSPLS